MNIFSRNIVRGLSILLLVSSFAVFFYSGQIDIPYLVLFSLLVIVFYITTRHYSSAHNELYYTQEQVERLLSEQTEIRSILVENNRNTNQILNTLSHTIKENKKFNDNRFNELINIQNNSFGEFNSKIDEKYDKLEETLDSLLSKEMFKKNIGEQSILVKDLQAEILESNLRLKNELFMSFSGKFNELNYLKDLPDNLQSIDTKLEEGKGVQMLIESKQNNIINNQNAIQSNQNTIVNNQNAIVNKQDIIANNQNSIKNNHDIIVNNQNTIERKLEIVSSEINNNKDSLLSKLTNTNSDLINNVKKSESVLLNDFDKRFANQNKYLEKYCTNGLKEKQFNKGLNTVYNRIDSLMSIHNLIKLNSPLPKLSNWAIGSELGNHLLKVIMNSEINVMVDIGSGTSTLVAGYALKKKGKGKVISIEGSEEYYLKTKEEISNHGLEEYCELHYCPFKEYVLNGKKWLWYDISNLEIGNIDLLLIDGPPGGLQENSRYPALPILKPYITNNTRIILDDANRAEEKQVVSSWVKEFELNANLYNTYKDFYELTYD